MEEQNTSNRNRNLEIIIGIAILVLAIALGYQYRKSKEFWRGVGVSALAGFALGTAMGSPGRGLKLSK